MNARQWFAINARTLLEARMHGMVPESQVNVSLIGQPETSDITLIVREDMPADRLDWRMLVNLNVMVLADTNTPFNRVESVIKGIAAVRPAWLHFALLVGDEYHAVDCGSAVHIAAVGDCAGHHDFFWFPIAIKSSPVAQRMKQALQKTIKSGAYL